MIIHSRLLLESLVTKLSPAHGADEALAIAYLLLENLTGMPRADMMANRPFDWTDAHKENADTITQRLLTGEPLQYILGEADFYGYRFTVTPAVLIPRPETELLIDTIRTYASRQPTTPLRVLDIGTGSGCIAITTALVCRAEVSATDISEAALAVSRSNAEQLNASVTFVQHDILMDESPFANLDVVVSNPPYIALSEKAAMGHNVVGFEPHGALFVPDDDALLFYRALAIKAFDMLRSGGMLCVEINERFGPDVRDLFTRMGYTQSEIVRDLDGKDRIVKAFKS